MDDQTLSLPLTHALTNSHTHTHMQRQSISRLCSTLAAPSHRSQHSERKSALLAPSRIDRPTFITDWVMVRSEKEKGGRGNRGSLKTPDGFWCRRMPSQRLDSTTESGLDWSQPRLYWPWCSETRTPNYLSYPFMEAALLHRGSLQAASASQEGCCRWPFVSLHDIYIMQADKRSGERWKSGREEKKQEEMEGEKGRYLPYVPEFIYFYELVYCYSGSKKG